MHARHAGPPEDPSFAIDAGEGEQAPLPSFESAWLVPEAAPSPWATLDTEPSPTVGVPAATVGAPSDHGQERAHADVAVGPGGRREPRDEPSPSEDPTVAAVVAATLARLGVGHVFGVVGSGNFALVNELRALDVPYTAARHEGGAATMADAFSRVSGQLAVVSTHQGCGFTNALTGIGEAAKSRTPLIVLTAAAPPSAPHNNFQMDQDAAARSVGAVAERVHTAASAAADAERAWRTAVTERRTVVLSVPIDLLSQPSSVATTTGATTTGATTNGATHRTERRAARADRESIARLVERLDASERPVFIAGRGAREAGAEIAELAARTGALLATSAVAKGLFRGDAEGRRPAHAEWDLGISGGFSTPLAAELIAGADLVVSWGCALNDWTTRRGRLLGNDAVLVQVDIEAANIAAHRPVDLGVVGDCAEVARDATEAIEQGHSTAGDRADYAVEPEADRARAGYRTEEVWRRLQAESRWRDVPFDDLSEDAARIDPRAVTIALDDALPPQRIVSVDSGNFMGYPSQFLEVPDVAGFCFTQAFQSIGLGLATAIGAAIARPDRLPVLGTGDGGFHMAIAELETAVRLGIPLVVLVYNDASYSAEVHHFGQSPTPRGAADFDSVVFPDTDIAAIARGFGADGITVRSHGDLEAMTRAVQQCAQHGSGQGTPLVIDAKIASDGGAWWLAEAFAAE